MSPQCAPPTSLDVGTLPRMAAGLGMTPEEWEELKSQVSDSFWVMRIIGAVYTRLSVTGRSRLNYLTGYPPLPNDYQGFSCGAHK